MFVECTGIRFKERVVFTNNFPKHFANKAYKLDAIPAKLETSDAFVNRGFGPFDFVPKLKSFSLVPDVARKHR